MGESSPPSLAGRKPYRRHCVPTRTKRNRRAHPESPWHGLASPNTDGTGALTATSVSRIPEAEEVPLTSSFRVEERPGLRSVPAGSRPAVSRWTVSSSARISGRYRGAQKNTREARLRKYIGRGSAREGSENSPISGGKCPSSRCRASHGVARRGPSAPWRARICPGREAAPIP